MWKRWKIFEKFDRIFEELENLDLEKLPGETRYWGYSAYVGPDGVPHVKTFGNVGGLEPKNLTWAETSELGGTREPYADVLVDEKNEEVIVTAEMPGIEKKDVKLNATETEIEISADAKNRKYYKKMPLGAEIDPENTKAEYNNGILEIRAPLKRAGKVSGHNIKVG